MRQRKVFAGLVLCTFFLFLRYGNDGANVTVSCNTTDEYLCSNGVCIPQDLRNNSFNDCGDNSDEAVHPCRAPLFSCRNSRCVYAEWVLDGTNDCIDGSDETKLIGIACHMVMNCCNCDDYVPHSECVDGICRCSKGFFSNQLGNVCEPRVLGSACSNESDCRETIGNSSCTDGLCQCDVGYHETSNDTLCQRSLLGDRCRASIDCQTVENSQCEFSSTCRCETGYAESADRMSCVAVLLNDTCHADDDCLVAGSVCRYQHCACSTGFYDTASGDVCFRRLLGNDCVTNDDCSSVIDEAFCVAGRCACADGRLATSMDGRTQSCVTSNDGRDVTVFAVGIFLLGSLVVFDSFLVIWMICNFVCGPRTMAQKLARV